MYSSVDKSRRASAHSDPLNAARLFRPPSFSLLHCTPVRTHGKAKRSFISGNSGSHVLSQLVGVSHAAGCRRTTETCDTYKAWHSALLKVFTPDDHGGGTGRMMSWFTPDHGGATGKKMSWFTPDHGGATGRMMSWFTPDHGGGTSRMMSSFTPDDHGGATGRMMSSFTPDHGGATCRMMSWFTPDNYGGGTSRMMHILTYSCKRSHDSRMFI